MSEHDNDRTARVAQIAVAVILVSMAIAFALEYFTSLRLITSLIIVGAADTIAAVGFVILRAWRRPRDADNEPTYDHEAEVIEQPSPAAPPMGSQPDEALSTTAEFAGAFTGLPPPLTPPPTVPDSVKDLPAYFEYEHAWSFYRFVVGAATWILGGLSLLGYVSFVTGPWTSVFASTIGLPWVLWLLWLAGSAGCVLVVKREHVRWRLRWRECDPRSGDLLISEAGSDKWVIKDSPTDVYPLAETDLDTDRTWFEQFVLRKRSSTLILRRGGKERRLRWVVDAEKIKAIATAWRTLQAQQRDYLQLIAEQNQYIIGQNDRIIRQNDEANRLTRRQVELLEQLLSTNQRVEVSLERLPGT